MSRLNSVLRRIRPFQRDFVSYDGTILPAPDKRWCGPEFRSDSYYVKSAEAEAHRLVNEMGCTAQSRILDIGCGQGRLPIGLSRVMGDVRYTGLDIDKWSVDWCRRHITRHHPSYAFVHMNIRNERYNRNGIPLDGSFKFDFPDEAVDIAYLFSVFSHMRQEDMVYYLHDLRRVMKPGGHLFFTTFVEDGVEDVSYNPAEYAFKYDKPLHVVRYNRDHLFALVSEMGFVVKNFTHRTETDAQSAVYLTIPLRT